MRRIVMIATGGTIASTRGPDGAVTATLSGEALLEGLPLPDGVHVEVVDLSVPGSWNLTTDTVLGVSRAVDRALSEGADGVVVTHGTDVLEESAWLLELLVRPRHPAAPVVLTAAMRHASEFGSDGPRNLRDAVCVAASPDAGGRGVLVCVNGELHHARHVVKTHATLLGTFESPGRGPVGEFGDTGLRFVAASPPAPPPMAMALGGPVPILTSHWDADPAVVGFHLDRGAAAFVVEATGAGNVHGPLAEALGGALDRGVPVVVASRCRRGRPEPIYGGAGGFATLHGLGALASPGLTAGKVRLAVQVALGDPGDDGAPAAVARYLERLDPRP
jgi:L-asparaginase